MATGTVKWFNGDKGFGFITPVGFELATGPKGPQAQNVHVIN